MSSERIIHIVDDDEAVRRSLAFLLSTNGYAVRTHALPSAFLSEVPKLHRPCLLTDLRMPEMTGVDLLHRLKALGASVPAIVITGHGDVPMAVEAMKAGAADFIEKPFEDTVLLEAIRRLNEQDAPAAGRATTVETVEARLDLLTLREREVFDAVVAGLANKTIAYNLAISPRTVEVHRANVMTKMQARNLPELVRFAMTSRANPGAPR